MRIDLIAGARPNFMKISPIIDAIIAENKNGKNISFRLIHTGQHYDQNMSGSFFEELGIPMPDINLGAGGGSQAEQTAKIMIGYESLLKTETTDLCLVVGDVTSTMACSIVAKKMKVKVAHVEAGIRSGDITMPEEINRLVTDSISDYFFTTSESANQNLINSGVSPESIFFVGNTMIDTLLKNKNRFLKPLFWDELQLVEKKYLVLTLHRPSNVDNDDQLINLIKEIVESSNGAPIVYPIHPRTKQTIERLNIFYPNLYFVEPMSYLKFNYLVMHSLAIITDSGGITEETTVLGIPCMTLRDSTERPETCTIGTNELIGINPKAIKPAMVKLFSGNWKKGAIPNLWDGKTAERICKLLINIK